MKISGLCLKRIKRIMENNYIASDSPRVLGVTEALYKFDFSEYKAKKNNRNILFVILVLIVWAGGFCLYITDFQIKKALPGFCYTSLMILVIMAIEMPLIQIRMRKIKAFIYDDRIVQKCGKHEDSIPWDNVTQVKIIENNKGETVRIQLRGKDKAIIWLYGLNEMEKLTGLIRQRIQDDILVNTKRSRLDERIVAATTAIVMMIVMVLITSLGAKAIDIFAILAMFVMSSFVLLLRPLSRSGVSPKWLETVFILLMFLLGIYGLVSFLRGGILP